MPPPPKGAVVGFSLDQKRINPCHLGTLVADVIKLPFFCNQCSLYGPYWTCNKITLKGVTR